MTRSHKQNNGDRTSHGIETYLPLTRKDDADEGRSTAPYKAKKDGGGKGNWYPSHLPKHTPNTLPSCLHAFVPLFVVARDLPWNHAVEFRLTVGVATATKSKMSSTKNKSLHPSPAVEATPTAAPTHLTASPAPSRVNSKSTILTRRPWRSSSNLPPLRALRSYAKPLDAEWEVGIRRTDLCDFVESGCWSIICLY